MGSTQSARYTKTEDVVYHSLTVAALNAQSYLDAIATKWTLRSFCQQVSSLQSLLARSLP